MADLGFLLLALAFFAMVLGYVVGCERLAGGTR